MLILHHQHIPRNCWKVFTSTSPAHTKKFYITSTYQIEVHQCFSVDYIQECFSENLFFQEATSYSSWNSSYVDSMSYSEITDAYLVGMSFQKLEMFERSHCLMDLLPSLACFA
ncbi:unnamed protein product [Urochloa humidicola]